MKRFKKVISLFVVMTMMLSLCMMNVSAVTTTTSKMTLSMTGCVIKSIGFTTDVAVKVTPTPTDGSNITAIVNNSTIVKVEYTDKKDSNGRHFKVTALKAGFTSIDFTCNGVTAKLPVSVSNDVSLAKATTKNSILNMPNMFDCVGVPTLFTFTRDSSDNITAVFKAPNYTTKQVRYYNLVFTMYDANGDKAYDPYTNQCSKKVKINGMKNGQDFIAYDIVGKSPDCAILILGGIDICYADGTTDYGYYGYQTTTCVEV